MIKYPLQVLITPGRMGSGLVNASDLQAEYELAISAAKALAIEIDDSIPEPLRERRKKAVLYAADVLLMMNTPRDKISGKLEEDFDGYISRATLFRYLKEGKITTDDGQSQLRPEISSFDPAIEQENEPFTILAEKMRDLWNSIAVKSRTVHILSRIPKAEADELLFLLGKNIENTSAEWDGRQDVSERQFQLLIAATMADNDKATQLYIKYAKEWDPLTGKQYGKLVHGKARLVPPLWDPKNRKEAVEIGFYGVQCACGSYRVHPSVEPTERLVVHCYACGVEFEAKTEKLPIHPGVIIDSATATHRA